MISVIVPCRNRLDKLKLCLDSIYKSLNFSIKDDSKYEIIVINDHSDEGFAERVLSFFPTIQIIDSDGVGPGYARNLGIKNSKGKYLFFTDSDCVVAPDWIAEGIKILDSTKALVVQGIPWLFQKNENIYLGTQEEKLYETMFSTYLYDKNKTKMTDSRNLLINKDITNILGNEVFSQKMAKATAESRVFGQMCLSKNIEILFDRELKIYHEDSKDIESVCRQKYRHGSGRIEIWSETPSFDYLNERYFTNPINSGNDVDYILPSHFAFLLGYFQNLNDQKKYQEFIDFSSKVFAEYDRKLSDYEIIGDMIDNC